jgi:hypothetical protein
MSFSPATVDYVKATFNLDDASINSLFVLHVQRGTDNPNQDSEFLFDVCANGADTTNQRWLRAVSIVNLKAAAAKAAELKKRSPNFNSNDGNGNRISLPKRKKKKRYQAGSIDMFALLEQEHRLGLFYGVRGPNAFNAPPTMIVTQKKESVAKRLFPTVKNVYSNLCQALSEADGGGHTIVVDMECNMIEMNEECQDLWEEFFCVAHNTQENTLRLDFDVRLVGTALGSITSDSTLFWVREKGFVVMEDLKVTTLPPHAGYSTNLFFNGSGILHNCNFVMSDGPGASVVANGPTFVAKSCTFVHNSGEGGVFTIGDNKIEPCSSFFDRFHFGPFHFEDNFYLVHGDQGWWPFFFNQSDGRDFKTNMLSLRNESLDQSYYQYNQDDVTRCPTMDEFPIDRVLQRIGFVDTQA